MKEKFFEKGNHLKDTNKLLTIVRKKMGIKAFLFTRGILLAAWYASIKPNTEYIGFWEVLHRMKKVMNKQQPTLEDIKKVNFISTDNPLFFGVPTNTILHGTINDIIVKAQEYYNTIDDDDFDEEEEDDEWFDEDDEWFDEEN